MRRVVADDEERSDRGAGGYAAEDAQRKEGEEQGASKSEAVDRNGCGKKGERERARRARIGGKRGAQALRLGGTHKPPRAGRAAAAASTSAMFYQSGG